MRISTWRRQFVGLAVLIGSLAILAASVGGQGKTKPEPGHCFLWKVTSKTTTVYLLGSMHVAKADLFPLPKEIEDAFARSTTLVVELDTLSLDQAKMQKLVLAKGLYPAGEKLSTSLSKKTLDRLGKYCANKKMEVAKLESMRPWLLTLILSVAEIKSLGLSEEGVDRHFLKKAKEAKKPVVELETPDAQIELLAGFSAELQEQALANLLTDLADLKNQIEAMITAWEMGDAKAMEKTVLTDPIRQHPESKPAMVKMFSERNVKMTEKIVRMLNGTETCFVVVGAGHVVGEKGIVKLLADKNYKVEQIKRAVAKQPVP